MAVVTPREDPRPTHSRLQRRTPLKRSRIRRSPPKPGFTRATKNKVLERCAEACEAQTPLCTGKPEHFHHRKLRSQGGSNKVGNCLAVCSSCHAYIHSHVQESVDRGWIIPSWA